MRLIASVVLLIAFGLSPHAFSEAGDDQAPPLSPQVMRHLLQVVATQGIDRELTADFANALGLSATGQSWLDRQFATDVNSPGELRSVASSRAGGQEFLFAHRAGNSLNAYRVHGDGQVVTAFAYDFSAGKITMRAPGEAQADFNREAKYWTDNLNAVELTAVCEAQLKGAHPVTAEKKIESCTTLMQLEKNNPSQVASALMNRGLAYSVSDTKKELEDMEEAVKADPKSALAWAELCVADMGVSRDYDRAMKDCTTSINLAPKESSGWTYRGDIYLHLRKYDLAIADYNHAIELDATWMWPWDNRGSAYLRMNQIDRSIQDFNEVIRLKPDYAMGYLSRGEAHLLKKEPDAAMTDFEAGIKVDPACGSCFVGLGLAERAKGNTAGGDADIAKGKTLSPKAAENLADDGIQVP